MLATRGGGDVTSRRTLALDGGLFAGNCLYIKNGEAGPAARSRDQAAGSQFRCRRGNHNSCRHYGQAQVSGPAAHWQHACGPRAREWPRALRLAAIEGGHGSSCCRGRHPPCQVGICRGVSKRHAVLGVLVCPCPWPLPLPFPLLCSVRWSHWSRGGVLQLAAKHDLVP